jgi:hypothetical protein
LIYHLTGRSFGPMLIRLASVFVVLALAGCTQVEAVMAFPHLDDPVATKCS